MDALGIPIILGNSVSITDLERFRNEIHAMQWLSPETKAAGIAVIKRISSYVNIYPFIYTFTWRLILKLYI